MPNEEDCCDEKEGQHINVKKVQFSKDIKWDMDDPQVRHLSMIQDGQKVQLRLAL
jgi:hypothetical protein